MGLGVLVCTREQRKHARPESNVAVLRIILLHGDIIHGALDSKQAWATNNICTIFEHFSLLECRGLDGAMTPDGWMGLDSIKDMMDNPKHTESYRGAPFIWIPLCCAEDVEHKGKSR